MCRLCNQCQITRSDGKFPKAPLQVTDIPSRPFEKVAIDIIGPLRVPYKISVAKVVNTSGFC